MATLEDKILGEKPHCYCSSSDSSAEESNDELDSEAEGASNKNIIDSNIGPTEPGKWNGVSSNTGPKGVIKDWQKFKQLEIQKLNEQQKEIANLIKQKSITCKSAKEDDELSELQKELGELFSDDKFLQQYRKQRMNEMLSGCTQLPTFGQLIHLKNGDEFLKALDDEHKSVTVVVHIYEDNVPSCRLMNKCLSELCTEYSGVKFCRLVSSSAGMSSHFKSDGVPALLVYKSGQMVGNFIRVTDELGDDFYSGDVENYLIEHGMINDKTCVPKIISQIEASSDSDG